MPIYTFAQPPANFPFSWQLSADNEFIHTTSNFSNSGSTQSLVSGGELLNLTSKLNLTYRSKPRWHFYGGMDYSYSKSSLSNVERTSGGLPYVRGGLRHFIPLKKFQLIAIGEANIAIQQIDMFSDDVLISDGFSKIEVGLWALVKAKSFTPYGFLGVVYHTDDFASPFIVRAGSNLSVSSSFSFFGELSYFGTAIDDKYAKTPNVRWALVNLVSGGSLRFYSVNPSHTDIGLGASYQMSSEWRSQFALDYTLEGQRYSQGLTARLSVSWNFGDTDAVRETISKPGFKKVQPVEKKFKEKLEDEDQQFFE